MYRTVMTRLPNPPVFPRFSSIKRKAKNKKYGFDLLYESGCIRFFFSASGPRKYIARGQTGNLDDGHL
jgi:hypothetical protein